MDEEELRNQLSFVRHRVTSLRLAKNISARVMSQLMGKSENYINRIELGKSCPSLPMLFEICDFLGVTIQEFFDHDYDLGDHERKAVIHDINRDLDRMDLGSLGLIRGVTAKMAEDSE